MTSSAAILWSAAHNQSALHRSAASEREADAEIDATYGPEGSIPETQPQQAIALAPEIPLFTKGSADYSTQSSVEHGYYLHSHGTGLYVLVWCH